MKFENLPQCFPYHPLSELNGKAGYYPNISPAQLRAASELYTLVQNEGLDINTDAEDTFLKLLRFLRARKFNVGQSFTLLRNDVHWRLQDKRLSLSQEMANEVLDCNASEMEAMYGYFPTWIQGTDKQMRPVSYRKFGKFEIWNVLKLTSMENLIRFHAWETEQSLRRMYLTSKETGFNIETFFLVVDAQGWNTKLATSDAYAFIKGMASVDSDHYPERLGTVVVINAPSMLSMAWRIVQGFLDSVTKRKIRILTKRADWEPVLKAHIDEDQIPKQYGGTAPDPLPEEALNSMNPPPRKQGATAPAPAAAMGSPSAEESKEEPSMQVKERNSAAHDTSSAPASGMVSKENDTHIPKTVVADASLIEPATITATK